LQRCRSSLCERGAALIWIYHFYLQPSRQTLRPDSLGSSWIHCWITRKELRWNIESGEDRRSADLEATSSKRVLAFIDRWNWSNSITLGIETRP